MDRGILDLKGRPVAIPLKRVRIRGDISGLYGRLSIEQSYVNEGDKDLEIIYTFPMPDRAVISDFSARVGDRNITGEIRDKEEAFKIYDQSLRRGDSAFLLEQFRPNVFQISLGRILQGEEVSIRVVYLETFSYQDGEMSISIPTLVAPRYIPGHRESSRKGTGWSDPTDRVPDADFITPPVDPEAAYRVELELNLRPLMPVDEFTSPSHPLHVTGGEDGGVRITLAEGSAPLDRDIVIRGRCRDEGAAAVLSWEDPAREEGYFYLNLLPILGVGDDGGPLNYIFLLDISGSMQGRKLEQAKNALQLCLRNMEAGDTFNIVAFESSCHYFSPEGALPFSQGSLERATKWIDRLGPMGGTEIMAPVSFALRNSGESGTVILLFTDGQVGNEQEIIGSVRRGIRDNRLFTFGIDTAVNSHFINRLAEAGKGLPEFIYPGERIEDKVIRQFYRINSPVVNNVAIRWSALGKVEYYPRDIPAIFDREPVGLVGRYDGKLAGTVALTGRLKGEQFKAELDLTGPGAGGDPGFLKKLWARLKIGDLEKELETINPRRREALIEEIVKVSREYGIGSSQTSFVAVQERETRVDGIPETVVVPVAPAAEWEMLSGLRRDLPPGPVVLRAPSARSPLILQDSQDIIPAFAEAVLSEGDSSDVDGARSPAGDLQEAVRYVAMQQQADGSFPAEGGTADTGSSAFESTALAALVLLLAAGDSGIYRRQIIKAMRRLMEQPLPGGLDNIQYFMGALAGKLYLDRIGPAGIRTEVIRSRIEMMQNRAGSLSAALEKTGDHEREMIGELYNLLGDRKSRLQEVGPAGGIKKLAAAIFREILPADRRPPA